MITPCIKCIICPIRVDCLFLHAEKREQFFDNLKTFCLEHDPDFQSTLVKTETDTSEIKILLETLLIG